MPRGRALPQVADLRGWRLGIRRDVQTEHVRWLNELPLGFRLYFWLWTLFVPAVVALLLVGAVVPGLVLLVLFVLDQAIFVPLIVARGQRQKRGGREGRR